MLALVFLSPLAVAQTGDATRGNTPPGMSQDGSRPADGAIKGGSILPGEQSGVPGKAKCEELNGTLREDCLKQEREAGTGGTQDPGVRGTPTSPPVTTPPQNPNPPVR
jgi:hypothetical protein